MKVVLLINYSRSGGTLISKILASLPNVWLLSEVNPTLNAVTSPAEQMWQWYGVKINGNSYSEQIQDCLIQAKAQNKNLVIRDFSFINFTPHKLNKHKPSKNLENLEALIKITEIKTLAFVRNTYDVWISRDCPPKFSSYYLDFATSVYQQNIPVVKYEDFCQNPNAVLQTICNIGHLNYQPINNQWLQYQNVTGDNQLSIASRGGKSLEILPLTRKAIAGTLKQKALNDLNFFKANQLFGYPQNEDEAYLNSPSQLPINVKFFSRLLFGKYPSAQF